jgi:hypothetical protein
VNVPDVVTWANGSDDCSRCGDTAGYYVTPYWSAASRLCSRCCQDLNRLFDTYHWPR